LQGKEKSPQLDIQQRTTYTLTYLLTASFSFTFYHITQLLQLILRKKSTDNNAHNYAVSSILRKVSIPMQIFTAELTKVH